MRSSWKNQGLITSDEETFPVIHERHRAFPAVFEKRNHNKILDVASGVGYVAQRILDNYPANIYCNDISPTALKALGRANIPAVSYTIDSEKPCFPFAEGTFDAVIALATIEHLIYIDNFVSEINRILKPDGYLYLSAPNYAGLIYLLNIPNRKNVSRSPIRKLTLRVLCPCEVFYISDDGRIHQ